MAKLIELSDYRNTLTQNIQERAKARWIEILQKEAEESRKESQKASSTLGLAKETVKGVGATATGLLKELGKWGARLGVSLYDVPKVLATGGKKTTTVNVPLLGEVESLQAKAGKVVGEVVEGKKPLYSSLGPMAETIVDVVSVVYTPLKSLKIIKGGQLAKGVIKGVATGGVYGSAFSGASALTEGGGVKEIAKATVAGAGIGVAAGGLLGAVGGFIGSKLKSNKVVKPIKDIKTELKTKPVSIKKYVGKSKDITKYAVTRPDLKVRTLKSLGKDIEGNKVVSRLEWNNKTNNGLLLLTSEADDRALAHEIGHYISKKKPELAKEFRNEVNAITGGKQNLNEDFASAIGEVIFNPVARKLAPSLTQQVKEFKIKFKNIKVKTEKLPKIKEKTVKDVQRINELQVEIGAMEESLNASPYSKVSKYINKRTGELPEVTGKKTGGFFERFGDEVAQELGFDDSEMLRVGYERYLSDRNRLKKLKGELREVRGESYKDYTAEDIEQINKLAQEAVGEWGGTRVVKKEAKPIFMGAKPQKKVKTEAVNWKHINTSTETEDVIKTVLESENQFKSVRPSRTNQNIIDTARALDIPPTKENLNKILRDMPNANLNTKLRQMAVDSANDLAEYLKTVDTGNLSKLETKTVRDKFMRTQGIWKTAAGLRTEASHLFRSMGIDVLEGENMSVLAKELKKIVGESGDDMVKMMNKSQKIVTPSKGETVISIWYNVILSGWKTWARNILDTTSIMFSETFSKVANPTTIMEVPRFVAGMLNAIPSSLYRAGRVLIGKEKFSSKLSYTKNIEPYFKSKQANLWLTEISGRILEAQDVVMSNMVKEAEKVVNKFGKQMEKAGIDKSTAVKLNNAMMEQFSERNTYRNQPMGVMGAISGGISKITEKVKALKFIVPFTRVVANVIDRKVDYLPFSNLVRTFGKKYIQQEANIVLKKSGVSATKFDIIRPVIEKRLRQQQLGRLYLGTLVTTGAYSLAKNDRISAGGPSNLNHKKQLEATGWRPYSIKLGDTWVPYLYLGPLSGIFAAVGSISDAIKYGKVDEEIWTKLSDGIVGFMQSNLSQSFLSGVSDLFDVMSGQQDPKKWVNRLITGLVPIPAFYNQTVDAISSKRYDIQTLAESLKKKFGLTGDLKPYLTALGEETKSDLIWGISPSKEEQNTYKEIEDRGLLLRLPTKTTKIEGKQMTRDQLWDYIKIRGELISKNIDQILKLVDAQNTQEMKEKVFEKQIDLISEMAKEQIKKAYKIKTPKKGFGLQKKQEIPTIKIKH